MMVDRQFSNQNGSSVAIIPSAVTPTPEPKWVTPVTEDKPETEKKLRLDDDMSITERLILALSEVLGTAVLLFVGCLGCASHLAGVDISPVQVSFTFGIAVMMAIQIFGHISGSHINPIVTVAAAILGKISLIQVPFYVTGQFVGGIIGYGLVKTVTPSNDSLGLCSPTFNPKISPMEILVIEFLLSLILVWVCCGIWDQRNSDKEDSVPIKFGLSITGLVMAGGHYTGASLNPARIFAPALINGTWKHHWVYWVGPFSAGILGALVYRIVFAKEIPRKESVNDVQISSEKT